MTLNEFVRPVKKGLAMLKTTGELWCNAAISARHERNITVIK